MSLNSHVPTRQALPEAGNGVAVGADVAVGAVVGVGAGVSVGATVGIAVGAVVGADAGAAGTVVAGVLEQADKTTASSKPAKLMRRIKRNIGYSPPHEL